MSWMETSGIRSDWNWGCISKMKRYFFFTKTTWITVVMCMQMGWISCKTQEIRNTFPHMPHFEEKMPCNSCHKLGESGFLDLTFDSCLNCHESGDSTFDSCLACHEEHNIEITEQGVVSHKTLFKSWLSEAWQDVGYDHAGHLEGVDEDCLACHGEIPASEYSRLKNLPTMKKAVETHGMRGSASHCQVCHLKVNLHTPPSSHDYSWQRTHGNKTVFTDTQSCLLCHEEAACFTCHSTNAPQDHTNLWRRKSHGIQASFDRSRCQTCHRNDECITCHKTAAGPIPPASYHSPKAQCISCHAPRGTNLRPAGNSLGLMPHRMMMGVSAQKCLECHG